jgi:hypothetical protein
LGSLLFLAAFAGRASINFVIQEAGGLKIAAGALKSLNSSVEMMVPIPDSSGALNKPY